MRPSAVRYSRYFCTQDRYDTLMVLYRFFVYIMKRPRNRSVVCQTNVLRFFCATVRFKQEKGDNR